MSRTFTLAVERVADDRRFADRFRRDPNQALRRYSLDTDQVDAIKAGDFMSLAQHGLDVEKFNSGDRHGWRPHWRKVMVGATVLGAVIGLAGSPTAAAADVCTGKSCPQPRLVGLRRVAGLRVRADTIRLGDMLVTRTSARRSLRALGARAGGRALGRRAIRALFLETCPKGCVGVVDGEPVLIADGT